jgi:nicotinate dehydrogenase subunit B
MKATFPEFEMPVLEPERYELHNTVPAYRFDLDRRDFFTSLGGGILILTTAKAGAQERPQGPPPAQGESGGGRRGGFGGGAVPRDIGAWLHIGEDGAVTVYTGKVEIGQGIRTTLAQVVAEELHAPLASVKLVMGDTDLVPYDAGTFGSQTTPQMVPRLRHAAAAAREMLLDLASEQLKADRTHLIAEDGMVTAGELGARTYGQLTKGQKLVKQVDDNVKTTPATEWKIEGKPAPKAGGREIVTGKHTYTPDVRRPGMLYGKILRPGGFGAAAASVDTSTTEKMSGVTVVRDGDFCGVTASSEWAATKALETIRADWKIPEQVSSKDIFTYLKTAPANGGGGGGGFGGGNNGRGSMVDGLAAAKEKLQRAYTVAYIAHSPLEPRCAVAEWSSDGKLTVWTGTQRPFGVKSELAQAFRIPEDQVRVIMPDMGSGYGGKHTGEVAIEAARLAKQTGKPVRVLWTREEEMTWAYFRPAGLIEVSSGVAADGSVTAWEFHNYLSGASAIAPVYPFPNTKIEFHNVKSPLKPGSYRGLAATANHFAREVHMDELAAAVKMEPLEFRLKNLPKGESTDRLRAVLETAAGKFGWGKSKPAADHGFGIAGGFEKGSYVASCAEVAVDRTTAKVKIVRVATAYECGAIINPDQLKNQVEGAVIQGIGGALFEAIDFAGGKILNPRFSRYRIPRFSDVPALETVLIDRKDLASAGAGETPIVGLAPAVSNAIFNATGVRLRNMPMAPGGVIPELKRA